jgi:hypothetical protein
MLVQFYEEKSAFSAIGVAAKISEEVRRVETSTPGRFLYPILLTSSKGHYLFYYLLGQHFA